MHLKPAPADAPQPVAGFGNEFPAILEFAYDGSGDEWVDFTRRERAASFWAGVLNVLIPAGIWQRPKDTRLHWVLEHVDGKPRTRLAQEYYAIEQSIGPANAFSEVAGPPISVTDDSDYFDMWAPSPNLSVTGSSRLE